MCGIAGIWHSNNDFEVYKIASKMAEKIHHRGPDDYGIWKDDHSQLAFSHRRLSILDLSSAGKQPFISNSGRFVIVFNGEIYNHLILREELSKKGFKFNWKSTSDTETLINCLEVWGIKKTLPKLIGMFAFALWDRNLRKIFFARDRFGEKPLYWGSCENNGRTSIFFASELISFHECPLFKNELDKYACSLYRKFGWIPAPYSIYKNVEQLSPGHFIEINSNSSGNPVDFKKVIRKTWWDPVKTFNKYKKNNVVLSEEEAISQLEEILLNTVSTHSISDVPIGTFLSGGIDSSLITSLLASKTNNNLNSFSISLPDLSTKEERLNEGKHAKNIANYLGINHTNLNFSHKEAINLIPSLPLIMSEPLSDPSILPTYMLCSETKKLGLSVALSGDGGDELFGGYNRHKLIPKIEKIINFIPKSSRSLISKIITELIPPTLSFRKDPLLKAKLIKLTNSIEKSNDLNEIYSDILSISSVEGINLDVPKINEMPLAIMLADIISYLPSDILTKVDRASMSVGLEVRSPFLDESVANFALALPLNMKIKRTGIKSKSKWILRQILAKYIPVEIFERPKSGFAIPLGLWLQGPLKEWANDLLSESKIKKYNFYDYKVVSKYWELHCKNENDFSNYLWSVLVAQSWLERFN